MAITSGIDGILDRLNRDLRREARHVERQASPLAVHRTRVAARRLRSFVAAIPGRSESRAQRRCIRDARALADELAAVRDGDVLGEWLLESLPQAGPVTPGSRRQLLVLLEKERASARRLLRHHTRSLVWPERLARLDQSVQELKVQIGHSSATRELARAMLLESAQALAQASRQMDGRASSLHRVRVQAKAYRYVIELLAGDLMLDSERLAAPARAAQQAVGRYLDARNARKWVARHRAVLAEPVCSGLGKVLARKEKRALKEARRALRKLAP
jgi:CHAD domain-containing protein